MEEVEVEAEVEVVKLPKVRVSAKITFGLLAAVVVLSEGRSVAELLPMLIVLP